MTRTKGPRRFSACAALVSALGLLGFMALAVAFGAPAAFATDESPAAPAAGATTEAPPPLPPEAMKVVPAEEGTAAATPAAEKTPKPVKKRRAVKPRPVQVEPANARLKLKQDAWIFTRPSKWSKHVKRGHEGKYVVVTGATRYFLRVHLKEGETGYVVASAVDLVKPADKIFRLTSNAAVLAEPNRWARKVAEVHRGHDVHVVGIALGYMQIRMKSGLVGFIPTSALE
jgi:hypothetical protein